MATSDTRKMHHALRTLYSRMFRRPEDDRTNEVVATLKGVPLFLGLSEGDLRELAEIIHQRHYRRDEYLYYEHDPGLGMYIVQRGLVRLVTEDADGSVHELRQVGECGFFGEVSILGDFRRMETAQAVTEATVLGFFSPDLKRMQKRQPRIAAAFVAALARHLAGRQVELMRLISEEQGVIRTHQLFSMAEESMR